MYIYIYINKYVGAGVTGPRAQEVGPGISTRACTHAYLHMLYAFGNEWGGEAADDVRTSPLSFPAGVVKNNFLLN